MNQKAPIDKVSVYEALSAEGFVFHEELVNTLFTAHKSGLNCILYGPGGYGKSEMALAFAKAVGYDRDQIGIFSVSNDTTSEEMFGNVNLEKLTKEQKFHINVESSVWSKPLVILEEAFDGNPATMAALKQVLTSGVYEYNDQFYEIKTKMVIICTNKSPNEFNVMGTDSIDALIQRFPVKMRVMWHDHSPAAYVTLLNSRFKGKLRNEEVQTLGDIFATNKYEGKTVSPRIAIHSAKVYQANKDLNDIRLVMPDIPKSVLSKYSIGDIKKEESLDSLLQQRLVQNVYETVKPHLMGLKKSISDVMSMKEEQRKSAFDALLSFVTVLEEDISESVDVVDEKARKLFHQLLIDQLRSIKASIESHRQILVATEQAKNAEVVLKTLIDRAKDRADIMEGIVNAISGKK